MLTGDPKVLGMCVVETVEGTG
eukprot:COSAG02_NODE_60633_length_270_cov_3.017544_1_plen_21_part_01